MASVINVAPGGDLVVAVGKDTEQKLVRVSGVLLRIASPVFNTMLGPAVSLKLLNVAYISTVLMIEVPGRSSNPRCLEPTEIVRR